MNKVILKGRLTADVDVKQTPNNIAVARFLIAVNRRFEKDKTDFITCEAWRNTAEFLSKYFKKGQEILICGELHIDKAEKDGKDVYYTKVVVDEVDFCGSKHDNEKTSAPAEIGGVEVKKADDGEEYPF